MSFPVSGSQYRIGWKLEAPSSKYAVGHPIPENRVAATPVATITVTGGGDAGVVRAGSYSFCYCDVVEGGFRTGASPWVEVVVASDANQISIGDTADNASPRVIAKQIYGKYKAPGASSYGPEFMVADGLAPASTPAYLFVADISIVPPLVDYTRKAPTFNETGTNFEFHFFEPKTIDATPDYKYIDTKQLTGSPGPRRKIRGQVDDPPAWTDVFDAARAVMHFWALMGRCTKQALVSGVWTDFVAGDTYDGPERRYVFTASSRRKAKKPGSVSIFVSPNDPGSDYAPIYFWQSMLQEVPLTTAGGKEVTVAAKFMSCGHTYHGIGVQTGGTGTGRPPVIFGDRQDAASETGDFFLKVQAALTTGFVTWRGKRTSGASYGSTSASNFYTYADSNDEHTTGGTPSVLGDLTEILDEQTPAQTIGVDQGSNRSTVCLQAGRLSEYDANDAIKIPRVAPFPGVYTVANPTGPGDDGTWSGKAPVLLRRPAFTDTHVRLMKGDGSADTPLEILSSTAKMSGGLKVNRPHGRRAQNPTDLRPQGELGFDISFSRDFLTREFEKYMQRDGRLVGQWALEGGYIWKSAGVYSIYREGVYIDCPQMAVSSSKHAVSGENTVEEQVTLSAEQPDGDPEGDHITVTIVTPQDIYIPS